MEEIDFFDNSFKMYENKKPFHNNHHGINEMLIGLENRFVSEREADIMNDIGFPQNSLYYHTNSKFGILNRMSIDFSGNPSSAYDLFELMQFIPLGSKLNECFNGHFTSRGLHKLNANTLADFLIEYHDTNPEYFGF